MWQRPHQHQQQCFGSSSGTADQPQQCQNHLQNGATTIGGTLRKLSLGPKRYSPQSSSPSHPHLHFPPPPNYPPANSTMAEDHFLAIPGPSSQPDPPWPNMDYSYAYYEPGPPTKHTNVPRKYPGTYREGSYRSNHTYLTRYGTEENIYEEISDLAKARRRRQAHQDSIMSLNQSLVEEEVRRVQHGHRRVLGELNLSVEAMLMPSNSQEGSDDTDRENEMDDQLADLLTVGPTDELLSPAPLVDLDSGFSGSSSGASYRSAAGSLRRGPERAKSATSYGPRCSTPAETPSKGFWGKKAWKKLAAFPSNISLNKSKEKSENPEENFNSLAKSALPDELYHILKISGFINPQLLSHLTEDDIISIEKFAQEDLFHLIDKSDYGRYYGKYKEFPEKFQIVPGYRKILNNFCQEIKSTGESPTNYICRACSRRLEKLSTSYSSDVDTDEEKK